MCSGALTLRHGEIDENGSLSFRAFNGDNFADVSNGGTYAGDYTYNV